MAEEKSHSVGMNSARNKEDKEIHEHLPKRYEKSRYYTWSDIEPHAFAYDLWVVLFGNVLDLTELIQKNISSPLCEPIIAFAGTDISHWFSHKTKEPKTRIDPNTGRTVYYCPNGKY